ncbi:MAG TPA: dTMP kinase [Thermoplasmatales archaeon]|nr:dTMP kinase [Thermoplasmatales archaeon]
MKKFITIEGIDGSGKSTLAKELHERLCKAGYKVMLTSEPYNECIKECIEVCLREGCNPITIAFLFMADRANHVEEIKRWIKEGYIVICDRYTDSTYAYQGAQLQELIKKPVKWMKDISERFILMPDRTFLLDIEPEVALSRLKGMRRFVSFENHLFLKKVRKIYLELAEDERFMILDAKKSVDELVNTCLQDILGEIA